MGHFRRAAEFVPTPAKVALFYLVVGKGPSNEQGRAEDFQIGVALFFLTPHLIFEFLALRIRCGDREI